MKAVGIATALLAVCSVLLFAQSNYTNLAEHDATIYTSCLATNRYMSANDYANGVNAALDAIILLSLEQQLQGTNRTWGAMAEIVCKRLSIERRK